MPVPGGRSTPSAEVECGRQCRGSREKQMVDSMQARQADAKAEVERQVAELHARLRIAQASFLQTRSNFDLLGIKLGASQGSVANLLAKEFPQAKDQRTGSRSDSGCAPRSEASRRNGDCMGFEVKPNGDPSAYNPQTREVRVYMTDRARVHGVYYKQANLYVANTQEGCEREREQFLAGVVAKYGQPFSRNRETVTWGAAMPHEDFGRAYSGSGYTLMGVAKSLDGDTGLVNDAQRVIYFQGGYALSAKCSGSSSDRFTMNIDVFLADTRIEEQDSSAAVSKPKL